MDTPMKAVEFEWRGRIQHIVFFITYILDWGLLNFLLCESRSLNPQHVPSLVHYLVVIIVVGSPVLFFQTFIGDYSGRGCIFMGEMLPVAYGLGYAMLLLSYVRFTYTLFYTLKTLEYLIVALFNHDQPWMSCSKEHYRLYPGCFQKDDIDSCPSRTNYSGPCFKPHTKILSALIYQRCNIFLRYKKVTWKITEMKFIKPFFHISILLPLLLIYGLKSMKSCAVPLRATMMLCLGALSSILVVMIIKPGAGSGFHKMLLQIRLENLLDLNTWDATLRRVILGLRLAEGGHILFGSYIPFSTPDFRRSFYLTIAFLFLVIATSFYFFVVLATLDFKLGMGIKDLDLDKEEATVYVTYPLVLGMTASPYLFSVLYFLVLFLISFHALVLNVFVMVKTVTSQFNINEYLTYIKVGVILLGTSLTFLLEYMSYRNILEVVAYEFKELHTCTLMLQILVLLTYGLQRLSDDMIFHRYPEAKKFTKFCWLITLIFCALSFCMRMKDRPASDVKFKIRMITCGTFSLPFVISFFIQTSLHIKRKDIIGLLKPSNLYGPADLERRILRILYNPRLAIRCKARDQICYHGCLNDSRLLEIAVQDEIHQIRKFVTDLQTNAEDPTLSTKIIAMLKVFEKMLLKGLPRGEST